MYVVVNVSNGAGSVVLTESDGYTVDTTAPEMRFIGDGSQAGTDIQYSVRHYLRVEELGDRILCFLMVSFISYRKEAASRKSPNF